MHPVLQRVNDAIEQATAGADTAALELHLEGKWSAAQILDHLSTTYAGTARLLGRCLKQGPTSAVPTTKQRVAKAVVFDLGYFPSGRKAPEFALPRGTATESVLREIGENLREMDRQLGACERQFGRRTRLAEHFIFGPLTAQEWRVFHLRHSTHHVKQIAALLGSRARSAAV